MGKDYDKGLFSKGRGRQYVDLLKGEFGGRRGIILEVAW
jgi:hypothetical protein